MSAGWQGVRRCLALALLTQLLGCAPLDRFEREKIYRATPLTDAQQLQQL